MKAGVTAFVCVTCRGPGGLDGRPGRLLFDAVKSRLSLADRDVTVTPVECLSVCKRPCTIGFSAPGKWTYIYGDFAPSERAAETILDAVALYAATPDGLIPWKQRPDALKKGVVARLPPLALRNDVDLPEAAE